MTTFPTDWRKPFATQVDVGDDSLTVHLVDGRVLSVPIDWYPRLAAASKPERENWRLIGQGEGIHWADVDEDISVDSLLLGQGSVESQRSLKKWLQSRAATG
jgi:hypothetical protein